MPKRSSKDLNQNAFGILQQITGENKTEPKPEKNPAAVALGRLGGLKGGKRRAKVLSKKEIVAIARKGAEARWKKKN